MYLGQTIGARICLKHFANQPIFTFGTPQKSVKKTTITVYFMSKIELVVVSDLE